MLHNLHTLHTSGSVLRNFSPRQYLHRGAAHTRTERSVAASELMSSSAPTVIQDQLSTVNNIRDLAEANPVIKPGRVFRCACPRDISEEDQTKMRSQLGISVLIDLRAGEERAEDGGGRKLWEGARLVRHSRSYFNCQKLNEDVIESGTRQLTLHHISFLERLRFMTGLLYKLPVLSFVAALTQLVISPSQGKASLLRMVNARGLSLVYEVLFETAQPEVVTALRVVLDALKQQQPLLFFCRAGKDRTGMLAMLVLSVSGASKEAIVEDYHRSDNANMIALAGIEKEAELADLDKSKFKGAPKEAILEILEYLDNVHGSPLAYLDSIGFSYEDQALMRKLMTT